MKNNITVSIGIPAYNEGANIRTLLSTLLEQKTGGFILKEILVISDGSNDDTARLARSIKDNRIKVSDDKMRLGKSARLQTIFKKFSGDILFLMDADIAITDNELLSKIIKNTNFKKAGLVSVNATPLPATTFFEGIVEEGVFVMKDITKNWRNGNNYLPFKGCFMGMSKELGRATNIPTEVVSNDSFLYFNAVEKGYEPVYMDNLFVYYRSPMTYMDHKKQSSRYLGTRSEMAKYFVLDWDFYYTIPLDIFAVSILKAFVQRPLRLIAYLGISLMNRMNKQTNITSMWSIAASTKEVLPYVQ